MNGILPSGEWREYIYIILQQEGVGYPSQSSLLAEGSVTSAVESSMDETGEAREQCGSNIACVCGRRISFTGSNRHSNGGITDGKAISLLQYMRLMTGGCSYRRLPALSLGLTYGWAYSVH